MMKNIDACSRQKNALIYQYLVTAFTMDYRDFTSHSYAYSYDVFHYYFNPCRVTATSVIVVTSSSVTLPATLHHFPIRCITYNLSHPLKYLLLHPLNLLPHSYLHLSILLLSVYLHVLPFCHHLQ